MRHRDRFDALGCVLALASNSALEIATDKDRTLEVARKLDIILPKTKRIDSLDDLSEVLAEFTFPFVLKPTISWTGISDRRLLPVEVVDRTEATEVTKRILTDGSSVLAQEFACGRREGRDPVHRRRPGPGGLCGIGAAYLDPLLPSGGPR